MEQPAATYQVLGAAIRARRMHLGLSLAECAGAAGISRPYLTQLELGQRKRMKPGTYKGLRIALDLPATDTRLLAALTSRKERHHAGRHEDPPDRNARP